MYCRYCGKELPEEAKFCFHCGQPVNSPEEKPENNAAKLRKWIIGGIALVGVIILIAVIGGIKNYNQRNADPEPEQGIEVFEQQELLELPEEEPVPEAVSESEPEPEEEPEAEPEPEPEEVEVAPDSVLLPDLEAFLYWSASTDKKYYDHGYQKGWNGSHPLAAYETVQQELLDLLAEERYQLELREMVENPHYGTPVYDFYYDYTGTSDSIVKLMDKYEEHDFDVCLSFFLTPEHNFFKISFKYSRGFQLEDPGTRTTRNMDPNSDGGVLVLPPAASDDSDWEHNSDLYNHTPPASKLKCLSCDGDGDCNTCGGDGYKNIGGAKAGCNTCRGNGKCRTCGGSGTR